MKLSVIVPVYNEKNTVQKIMDAILAVPIEKEIIIVDDGSNDGTCELIQRQYANFRGFKVILHGQNQGKGKAVGTGVRAASGEAVIIQDADLEYDPRDYPKLLRAMEENRVNVVYGSRFLGGVKVTALWHRSVNYFLTLLTNALYGSRLTDMETCYKLIKIGTLRNITIESNGFEIEAELSAKLLKMKERILEVPISYKGRSYHQGKKIGWRDGVRAVITLFYYRFHP